MKIVCASKVVVLSQKRPKWLVVSGGDRYKDRLPDSNKNDNIWTRQGTVQPARFALFVASFLDHQSLTAGSC